MLIVSMAFGGHGTMSAASTQRNDKLQKVEQKENRGSFFHANGS